MEFRTWPPLVVDVEGNGAAPLPDLVEVATVPVAEGRADSDRSRIWLIRPQRPITRFATSVHGITNEAVADAKPWSELGPQIQAELDGVWIAAHNAASVEYRILKAHLPTWEPVGVIDTLRLARAVYTDAPKHNLDVLLAHAHIDVSGIAGERHRAGFDAAATALLLIELAKHFDTFDALTAVGVPADLPGDPKLTRQSEPEAEALW